MATLYQVPTQNNLQYTLGSQLAQGGSSAVLNVNVAGIVQAPGVFVVDRVDANGNKTPTVREYISFTGVSTNTLTGLSKGLAGSTDQVHNVGAVVEFVPDVTWASALYNVFTTEHSTSGTHGSLPSIGYANAQKLISANATLSTLVVPTLFSTSGASLAGIPMQPVWVLPGSQLGGTVAAGMPLVMPRPGQIQYLSIVAGAAATGVASFASLMFDVRKNGSSVVGSNLLTLPAGGTYVSLASLSTFTFNSGDVFSIVVSNASTNVTDVAIQLYAR